MFVRHQESIRLFASFRILGVEGNDDSIAWKFHIPIGLEFNNQSFQFRSIVDDFLGACLMSESCRACNQQQVQRYLSRYEGDRSSEHFDHPGNNKIKRDENSSQNDEIDDGSKRVERHSSEWHHASQHEDHCHVEHFRFEFAIG